MSGIRGGRTSARIIQAVDDRVVFHVAMVEQFGDAR